MSPLWLCSVLALFVSVPASLDILYPFGTDNGDVAFSEDDEGYFQRPVTRSIPIFGTTYDAIYMHINGMISFENDYVSVINASAYYYNFFDTNYTDPILMPLWSDWTFLASPEAKQYMREITDGPLLERVSEDVTQGLLANSALDIEFNATYLMVMTYFNFTFWGGLENSPKNTIQVLLTSDDTRTFAIFQYSKLEVHNSWLPSFCGYVYDGFVRNHPYSGTDDMAMLPIWSNVQVDGRMMLQVDDWYETENCCSGNGFCLEFNATTGSQYCLCFDAYTGQNCDTEIDECRFEDCSNAGTCIDGYDTFTCECVEGFSGELCEIKQDTCEEDTCNNGTCTETIDSHVCDCYEGFTGESCDFDINECESCPCVHGNCIDHIGYYTCDCDDGYVGRECRTDINYCSGNECTNGGLCINGLYGYICKCLPGFTGRICEVNIDECTFSTECENGRCVDDINKYRCECESGFKGQFCDEHIVECLSDPCIHGECFDGVDEFTCECESGYTGVMCETDIRECESSPCLPNGICVEGMDGYECECYEGFSGSHCEINTDDCLFATCNHGACVDGEDVYHCVCEDGFTGRFCDLDINECQGDPCFNHANCSDAVNAYICSCPEGFTGHSCEVDIDDCASHPCHNSYCVDGVARFHCLCLPGFTGDHCEVPIDECISDPCLEGVCRDSEDSYFCDCPEGIGGLRCEIDERFEVGEWDDWGHWGTCSKLCDSGLQTRYRQCLRVPCREKNKQSQLCNTNKCTEDSWSFDGVESYAVTLETSKSEREVVENEQTLKVAIAEAVNSYCSRNRAKCCRLVNITTPSSFNNFSIFVPQNVSIASGYPMRITELFIHVKILVRTSVSALHSACTGRYVRSVSRVLAPRDGLYIPLSILKEAVHENIALLNEAICCWEVVDNQPIHNVTYILVGILLPVGLLLVILLVVFITSPRNILHHLRATSTAGTTSTDTRERLVWPGHYFYTPKFARRRWKRSGRRNERDSRI